MKSTTFLLTFFQTCDTQRKEQEVLYCVFEIEKKKYVDRCMNILSAFFSLFKVNHTDSNKL